MLTNYERVDEWAKRAGFSQSFARTLRKRYGFGKKFGSVYICTFEEWDEAFKRHCAEHGENAGFPKPRRDPDDPVRVKRAERRRRNKGGHNDEV